MTHDAQRRRALRAGLRFAAGLALRAFTGTLLLALVLTLTLTLTLALALALTRGFALTRVAARLALRR